MNRPAILILPALFFLLTGFSWENPSSGGDTVSPGETVTRTQAPKQTENAEIEEKTAPQESAAEEAAEETAPAQEKAAPEIQTPAPGAQNIEAAKISLFVNDAKNQKLYRGWPLFVKVVLENPAGNASSPIVFEKGKGTWEDVIEIEVKDEKGRLHDWPFRLAPIARLGRRIRLDAGEAASIVFLIDGRHMQAKAGIYTLEAAVGKQRSDHSVEVHVENHPESLSEEQQAYREKLNALYDALTGKKPRQPARRTPAPPSQPQVVYVQAESAPEPEPQTNNGSEVMSEILGLVSEYGMQKAIPSGDYASDYSDNSSSNFTDYTPD